MVSVQSIIEAISKIDPAKVQAAGSLAELQELLKAEGVTATGEEIEAAIAELEKASGKKEVSEEALEQVAGGGFNPIRIIPIIGPVIDTVIDLVKGKPKKEDPKPTQPAQPTQPGLNQNNSDNQGAQQNSQTGNNTNSQGMTVNIKK